jgi:AraC-like DNA-binding protein
MSWRAGFCKWLSASLMLNAGLLLLVIRVWSWAGVKALQIAPVILDKTRQAMVARYICDSSISLTQLADLLGYADLSAFSRAFNRWNGMSPQKWKQHLQQALHASLAT